MLDDVYAPIPVDVWVERLGTLWIDFDSVTFILLFDVVGGAVFIIVVEEDDKGPEKVSKLIGGRGDLPEDVELLGGRELVLLASRHVPESTERGRGVERLEATLLGEVGRKFNAD